MLKGVSLHIGLNHIDAEHYGSECRLPNCVNDAYTMQAIADLKCFRSRALVNEAATLSALQSFLDETAGELFENDILFLSFSGHGGLLQDINGDEGGGMDQTFLLYDQMIVDDQLNLEWAKFRKGVRILVVADSCHSGTVTKGKVNSPGFNEENSIAVRTYKKHQRKYDAVLKNITPTLNTSVECSIILLAACQNKEFADAGSEEEGSLSTFTDTLVGCWDNNSFHGSYKDFYKLISFRMHERKAGHRPNYYVTGRQHDYFELQLPFAI